MTPAGKANDPKGFPDGPNPPPAAEGSAAETEGAVMPCRRFKLPSGKAAPAPRAVGMTVLLFPFAPVADEVSDAPGVDPDFVPTVLTASPTAAPCERPVLLLPVFPLTALNGPVATAVVPLLAGNTEIPDEGISVAVASPRPLAFTFEPDGPEVPNDPTDPEEFRAAADCIVGCEEDVGGTAAVTPEALGACDALAANEGAAC